MEQHRATQSSTEQHGATRNMRSNTELYGTTQNNTEQYGTIQNNTDQHGTSRSNTNQHENRATINTEYHGVARGNTEIQGRGGGQPVAGSNQAGYCSQLCSSMAEVGGSNKVKTQSKNAKERECVLVTSPAFRVPTPRATRNNEGGAGRLDA
eukprot:gene10093-biopygen1731